MIGSERPISPEDSIVIKEKKPNSCKGIVPDKKNLSDCEYKLHIIDVKDKLNPKGTISFRKLIEKLVFNFSWLFKKIIVLIIGISIKVINI